MTSSKPWKDSLMNAIEDKDTDLALHLINAGHHIEGEFNEDYAPLHIAVLNNNIEVCSALLTAKANVNAVDKFGVTPLVRASYKPISFEILALLVSAGADLKITTPSSVSALHIAARWSSAEKFKYLLELPGANPNIADMFQRTPLHCVLENHEEPLRLIRAKSLLLLHSGACVNAQDYIGETAIDYAERLSTELLDLFFQYGSDPSIRDEKGDNFLNRHLRLERSFESDIFLKQFLSNGCSLFSKEVVRSIINDHGSGGNTPFLHACAFLFGPVEEIQSFIKSGAEINSSNSMGKTPLHLASRELYLAYPGVVEYLLENGADVNAMDIFGETPIYRMKTTKLVSVLLDSGADMNSKDRNGRPPLLALMNLKDTNILNILLDRGADLTCKDNSGSSPLHYAAYHDDLKATKLLVQNGADTNVIDALGFTPKQYAEALGSTQVSNYLGEINSKIDSEVHVLYDRLRSCSLYVGKVNQETPKRSDKFDVIDYKSLEERNQSLDDILKVPDHFEKYVHDILSASGIGTVSHSENEAIKASVNELIENICSNMKKKDKRFKMTVIATGSASEGVKVGDPDEFDFVCCLDEFADICKVIEIPTYEHFGFAKLILANAGKRKEFEPFFKDNDTLWSDELYKRFFFLLDQVITDGSIWTNEHLIIEERIYIQHSKPIFNLNIIWVGSWYKRLKISIDIAPAIRIKSWIPACVCDKKGENIPFVTEDVLSEGCFFLLQPISEEYALHQEEVVRVSIAPIEMRYLRSLPEEIRLSYCLAKSMRNESLCPPVQFDMNDYKFGAESVISSYMLKNCLFQAVKLHGNDLQGIDSDEFRIRVWTIRIYEILRQCCEMDNLPAFFLERQNVFYFGAIFLAHKEEEAIRKGVGEQNRRRLVFIGIIEKLLGLQKLTLTDCKPENPET